MEGKLLNTRGKVFFKEEIYKTKEERMNARYHKGDIIMVAPRKREEPESTEETSEQLGYRPALIIQNDTGNYYSPTLIIAYITASESKADIPTHMDIELDKPSLVLFEQIRTVDKTRVRKKLGRLKREYLCDMDFHLAISFGMKFQFTVDVDNKKGVVTYGRDSLHCQHI
jgi:mRNA interferase MazF